MAFPRNVRQTRFSGIINYFISWIEAESGICWSEHKDAGEQQLQNLLPLQKDSECRIYSEET